jgi:hypothetical protein
MASMFGNFPAATKGPSMTKNDVLGPVIAEQSKMKNSGFQRLQELMNSNVRPSFPSIRPSYGPNFPSSNFYGNSWQNSYNPRLAMNRFPFNNGYNQH